MIDFGPELRKRLDAEISRRGGALVSGAASDFADYRNRVGELAGLRAAGQIADDIQKAINEE